jgi:Glycosyl transferase family 2
MNMSPQVSVVIPTRDRPEFANRAVALALAQRDVDLEVIVVDDGSREPLPRYPDPRVRVVRQDVARGVAIARNRGIGEADGSWVAFFDDDDLWSPDKLRMQLEAAVVAGASFVYSAAVFVDARIRVLRTVSPPDPATLVETLASLNAIPAGSSNVVARAEVLRELGGFDEQLLQIADWDLWHRLAGAAPAAATNEILVAYVMHPQAMLLANSDDVADEFRYFATKVARGEGTTVDPVTFSRWVAGGHLRAGRRTTAALTLLQAGVSHRDPGTVLRGLAAPLGERAMFAYWRLKNRRQRSPAWLDTHRRSREPVGDVRVNAPAEARVRVPTDPPRRSGRLAGRRSMP